MGEFQPTHILLVLLVVVLLFGGSRFAAIGKGMGEGIRNFRKGLKGVSEDAEGEKTAAVEPAPAPAPANKT